jgi:protein-S-isoprenylcysteine O-methyltransferase Ste14/predicted DCC family thiol-disulfide oxidoreductase YuxK
MSAALPIREARPASTAWNVSKTLILMPLLWGVFFFGIPYLCSLLDASLGLAVYSEHHLFWRILGASLFIAGSTLHLVSNLVMAVRGEGTPLPLDCPRRLVIAGPYRHVRNPMAIAAIAQAGGVALFLNSPLALLYTFAILLLENFLLQPAEEADLERRFGDVYRQYHRRVAGWRPRLRAYDFARENAEPPIAEERTTPPGRYVVLYDGHCKLCTASAKQLAAFGRPGALHLMSFQEPGVLEQYPGISHEACMRQMYLVTPEGRVYGGFEAAVQGVATRPVLGWLAYVYYLPGVRLLCDLVYALIAANRYRILGKTVAAGECDGGTCALHFPPPTSPR